MHFEGYLLSGVSWARLKRSVGLLHQTPTLPETKRLVVVSAECDTLLRLVKATKFYTAEK